MADDRAAVASEKTRIFATAPTAIVMYELVPFDEPVIEKDPTSGIRREVRRSIGEALNVRSVLAHIEGKIAHPLDGGEPLTYGPGKPGCWGRNLRDRTGAPPPPPEPKAAAK